MIKLSYINFWSQNENNIQDFYFTRFIEKNIGNLEIVHYSKSPDILISSCFGDINKVKYIKARIKLFFYGENLERYPQYNNVELLKSVFDIILGFKYTNKDNKLFRFPLWLCYYPYYNINEKEHNIIEYLEGKYKNSILNKTIFGTLISSHDTGGQRVILLNELIKYGKVICPGNYNNNHVKISQGNKAKVDFIKQSKYNICPENSKYEGYFTEKIFQAFEGGTIPIYWAIDEPEKECLNRNKYCFIKNINDKNDIERKIKEAVENPEKYLEGNIFNDNAYKIIGNYYNDLIEEIKQLLEMR